MNVKTIVMVGLTLIFAYTQSVTAEELSRDDFLTSMKEDLLKPCSDSDFMKCISSNKSVCITKVNQLILDCKSNLPAVLTDDNLDASADNFSVCFSDGIKKKFFVSEKKYNTCAAPM